MRWLLIVSMSVVTLSGCQKIFEMLPGAAQIAEEAKKIDSGDENKKQEQQQEEHAPVAENDNHMNERKMNAALVSDFFSYQKEFVPVLEKTIAESMLELKKAEGKGITAIADHVNTFQEMTAKTDEIRVKFAKQYQLSDADIENVHSLAAVVKMSLDKETISGLRQQVVITREAIAKGILVDADTKQQADAMEKQANDLENAVEARKQYGDEAVNAMKLRIPEHDVFQTRLLNVTSQIQK